MLHSRLLLASFAAAAVLVACRGASNDALPSDRAPVGGIGAAASGITFASLGPTHMSDGYATSGKVNAVAVDPTNANIIYVGSGRGTGLETYSSAGILKTTDGGNSWTALTNGLVDPGGLVASVVNALWIDPNNANVLLAGTEYAGIFRTSDGGASWTNVFKGAKATQFVSFGSALYAADGAGILTSTDDGKTWSVQVARDKQRFPTALAATSSGSGDALYAGMNNGYVYAYTGSKWSRLSRLPFVKGRASGSTRMVHQMTVDPFAPKTVYVSTNDGSWDQNLFASTDGGKTWTAVLPGEYYNYGLGTQAIAFSTVHQHRLYLGEDGGFYYITGDGSAYPPVNYAANLKIIDVRDVWTAPNGSDDACWVASDQGLDYAPTCSSGSYRDNVVTASASTGLARRFTVSPDGKTLLVSLQDFDSHLTTNGGSNWTMTGLYEDGFTELRPGSPNTCYAYDEAYGLSISSNGCVSFSGGNANISPSRIMTDPIAFDPTNPQTMYFASGPNPGPGFYGPKGIFESTNGGTTVTQLSWPFTWPGAIVVDGRNGSHIVVCDLNNGASSLSVTTDGGKTWTKSTGVIPTKFWYALTISPVNGKTVLASSVDGKNNVFVLRSNDGGKTFAKIATIVNAPLVRGRADIELRLLHRKRARGENEREGQASQAFVYSPEREIRYNQDVTSGTADVAITTLRGAYVSSDNGSTWQRLDGGLVAHSFWGIRWLNGYLYLASDGQGVLRSTSAVQQTAKRRSR